MRRSCERAVALGLPAVAFTEHLDHTVWRVAMGELDPNDHLARMAQDGLLRPPPFDVVGYLTEIDECRARYPELRILTGLELGEPHRHLDVIGRTLEAGTFDLLLGSLHSLRDGDEYAEPPGLFEHRDPGDVLREYLAEIARLVVSDAPFEVLAHIDYPVRSWPVGARRFDPREFEAEFRHALRATADSGRALEVSTRTPLDGVILGWWRDEGGDAVTFGSDAHRPEAVARGFAEAAEMAQAHGFRPGDLPYGLWPREA